MSKVKELIVRMEDGTEEIIKKGMLLGKIKEDKGWYEYKFVCVGVSILDAMILLDRAEERIAEIIAKKSSR